MEISELALLAVFG